MLFLALSLGVAQPAQAGFCLDSVCILSIKRSAKNYWEYRATVSVDKVVRPVEVYNCRDLVRVRQDGKGLPFQPNAAGELICRFFKK